MTVCEGHMTIMLIWIGLLHLFPVKFYITQGIDICKIGIQIKQIKTETKS